MGDSSRTVVLHDFHRASRKAEESALRRLQAAAWLESFIGPLGLSDQPSEIEFVSLLRNGRVLCNLINKIHPGTVPKVIEGHGNSMLSTITHETQPLPAYQYFENVRNFLLALEELNLPAFEASDLERDSLDAGSTDKIVDCILSLKSYYEWKEWSGGVSFSRHLKSPVRLLPSSRSQLRATPVNSVGACRHLDMPSANEKTSSQGSGSEKLEDSVVGAFVECLLDSKENVDHKLLESFRNGTKDSKQAFNKLMAGCLQDQQLDQFPELKALLSPSEEENTSKPVLTESSTGKCKLLSCLKSGNCNHWKALEIQEKDLLDLKVLLSKTKDEFRVLQSQYQTDLQELGNKVQEISHAALGYQRVIKENRNLYNMVQDLKGNIRVYCRIRPIFGTEARTSIDHIGDDGSLVVLDPSRPHKDARKIFQFNRIFGPTCSQGDVYKETQPLIRSVMDGYNVCIFAYGQTGSGKTHTMCGPSGGSFKDMGINYLALNDLFEISCTRKNTVNYEIQVQMVEIYNEQVRDLLTEDSSITKLEIRSCTSNGGLSLPQAAMHVVKSPRDVLNLMKQGEMNRCVSSTAVNDQSSRSHSVLTVHVQGKDVSGNILRSCLHLVDLAGSERVDKSEVTGDRLKEAQYINKSLSSLGDVITALAQKNSHIPYRNSKLTQLLQDSLGGRAKTLMFAHVSPEEESYGETVSTLKFAQRVSTVELGAAHMNKESHEVKELKEQVETLKKALANKAKDVRSPPREKVTSMTDRTPPRPRRLSIDNSFVKIEKSVDPDNRKVSKTPGIESRTVLSHPRRLSLEPPRHGTDQIRSRGIGNRRAENISSSGVYRTENLRGVSPHSSRDTSKANRSNNGVSADTSISSRSNYSVGADASSVTTVRHDRVRSPSPSSVTKAHHGRVRSPSPNSVCQSRIGGIESKIKRPIQIAMTPEPPSPQSGSPAVATNSTKKGSHLMRSLHSIGKLLNPSEKRTQQHSASILTTSNAIVKTPPAANARTLRRQSLVGDQSSGISRRSSLGGKTAEPQSTGKRNAKTPPPARHGSRQWL